MIPIAYFCRLSTSDKRERSVSRPTGMRVQIEQRPSLSEDAVPNEDREAASLLTRLDFGTQAVSATDILLPESALCARKSRCARVHRCIIEWFPVLSRFGRFERTEYTAIRARQRVDFGAQEVEGFR